MLHKTSRGAVSVDDLSGLGRCQDLAVLTAGCGVCHPALHACSIPASPDACTNTAQALLCTSCSASTTKIRTTLAQLGEHVPIRSSLRWVVRVDCVGGADVGRPRAVTRV